LLYTEFMVDASIFWKGKEIDNMNVFICFDLNTGKITGKLSDLNIFQIGMQIHNHF